MRGNDVYVDEKKSISCCAPTWRLWRHCCCRYGWYPLGVAPLVTAGCILSLYSSAGCDFIRVQVGFTPSNDYWKQSQGQFGIFMYQSFEKDDNALRSAFVEGCRLYGDEFKNEFVEDDQTWAVTIIMAYISAVASAIAMMTSWLFVLTPLPTHFFWPGFLLPALMTAFLTEGSKFLIFDTAMCRSTAWFPSGADSLPRVAEECTIGATGACTIASVSIFFISLILVCLKAPEKRPLELNYATDYEESDFDRPKQSIHEQHSVFNGNLESVGSSHDIHHHASVPQHIERRVGREIQFTPNSKSTLDAEDLHYFDDYAGDGVVDDGRNLDPSEQIYPSKYQKQQDELSIHCPNKSTTSESKSIGFTVVSESRLRTRARMQRNAEENSTELIDKFVRELNVRFDVVDTS